MGNLHINYHFVEFECFGHDYFLNEFKALLKRVKDTEFNLKSQMGLKKKTITLEK